MKTLTRTARAISALLLTIIPGIAAAEDQLSAGDTAWMLTSTALVLFMTIPGLSLFYAGMVRAKNALSVMMQCFAITCLVTLLWVLYLYSLTFGDDIGGFVGGLGLIHGLFGQECDDSIHLRIGLFNLAQMSRHNLTNRKLLGSDMVR